MYQLRCSVLRVELGRIGMRIVSHGPLPALAGPVIVLGVRHGKVPGFDGKSELRLMLQRSIRELRRGFWMHKLRRGRHKHRGRNELHSLRCRPVRGEHRLDRVYQLRCRLLRFELGHVGVCGMPQGLLPDLARPRLLFSL